MKPLVFSVFTSILASCAEKGEFDLYKNYINKINNVYHKRQFLQNAVYLINFSEGCMECIKITENFIKANINNNKITYIISDQQKKRVIHIYGLQNLIRSNFILDDQDITGQYGFTIGISIAIFYNSGEIVKVEQIHYEVAHQILDEVNETIK